MKITICIISVMVIINSVFLLDIFSRYDMNNDRVGKIADKMSRYEGRFEYIDKNMRRLESEANLDYVTQGLNIISEAGLADEDYSFFSFEDRDIVFKDNSRDFYLKVNTNNKTVIRNYIP